MFVDTMKYPSSKGLILLDQESSENFNVRNLIVKKFNNFLVQIKEGFIFCREELVELDCQTVIGKWKVSSVSSLIRSEMAANKFLFLDTAASMESRNYYLIIGIKAKDFIDKIKEILSYSKSKNVVDFLVSKLFGQDSVYETEFTWITAVLKEGATVIKKESDGMGLEIFYSDLKLDLLLDQFRDCSVKTEKVVFLNKGKYKFKEVYNRFPE